LQLQKFEIALLTNLSKEYSRISMHGVRETLLDAQAASLGMPLHKIYLSNMPTNDEYEQQMTAVLSDYKRQGVSKVAFGDIFLKDLKQYRENNLQKAGMTGIFPIWKCDSSELAHKFMSLGFKAIITCVDTQALDKSFSGRIYDKRFLTDLPQNVDPCGENGEFHSFVFNGPIFHKAIPIVTGEKVLRDNRFYFCDLEFAS
jgi:uncharacterized protein (TIGR00290 family)